MVELSAINHQLVIGFVAGALSGSFITWYVTHKTGLSGDKLSLLQMINVVVLIAYMFISKAPQETVIITLAGFLFGEPLGRVIAGGKDDKKN